MTQKSKRKVYTEKRLQDLDTIQILNELEDNISRSQCEYRTSGSQWRRRYQPTDMAERVIVFISNFLSFWFIVFSF